MPRVVARAVSPPLRTVCDEPVDGRHSSCDVHRRRLDHGQRADQLRGMCGCEQRDHSSGRVPNHVAAGQQALAEGDCVDVEVHPFDRRVGSESRPFPDVELEPVVEHPLSVPGRPPAHDAAVHEHDPLHDRHRIGVTN